MKVLLSFNNSKCALAARGVELINAVHLTMHHYIEHQKLIYLQFDLNSPNLLYKYQLLTSPYQLIYNYFRITNYFFKKKKKLHSEFGFTQFTKSTLKVSQFFVALLKFGARNLPIENHLDSESFILQST